MARFLFSFGDMKLFNRWDDEMQKYLEDNFSFPTTFSKWYEWPEKPDIGETITIGSIWFSPFRVVDVKHQLDGREAGIEIEMEPIMEPSADAPPLTRAYFEEMAKMGWMADYKPIVLE